MKIVLTSVKNHLLQIAEVAHDRGQEDLGKLISKQVAELEAMLALQYKASKRYDWKINAVSALSCWMHAGTPERGEQFLAQFSEAERKSVEAILWSGVERGEYSGTGLFDR